MAFPTGVVDISGGYGGFGIIPGKYKMRSVARGAVCHLAVAVGALEAMIAVLPGIHDIGRQTIFYVQLFFLVAWRANCHGDLGGTHAGIRIADRQYGMTSVTVRAHGDIGFTL